MSNRLEELHYQYKRYYLKKALKAFGLIVIIGVLGTGGYLYTQTPEERSAVEPSAVQTVPQNKIQVQAPVAAAPSYVISVSPAALEESAKRIEQKTVVAGKAPASTPPKHKQVYAKIAPVEEKTFENYFTKPDEEKSLDAWIEKYNQKKSYTLAIAIAKQYYFDNEYKEAGAWSKRANQLDRDKEEAWLYYAKSMHALGDTTKAKKILNIYLQYKESTKAELLLVEWSQEEL